MLIIKSLLTGLCTIALHTTCTCMDYTVYMDPQIKLAPIERAKKHPNPCCTELPNEIWKKIANNLVTQNIWGCEDLRDTRALRSTCKLLYKCLPEPPQGSTSYRLWRNRQHAETIQKRKEIIRTTFCICYCGIWLPAVCGAAVATAIITGKEWTALIPIGCACVVHCAGAFIGYESQKLCCPDF